MFPSSLEATVDYIRKDLEDVIDAFATSELDCKEPLVRTLHRALADIQSTEDFYREPRFYASDVHFAVRLSSIRTSNWATYFSVNEAPVDRGLHVIGETSVKKLIGSIGIELKNDRRFKIIVDLFTQMILHGYALVFEPESTEDEHVTTWYCAKSDTWVSVNIQKDVLLELNNDPPCRDNDELLIDHLTCD